MFSSRASYDNKMEQKLRIFKTADFGEKGHNVGYATVRINIIVPPSVFPQKVQ